MPDYTHYSDFLSDKQFIRWQLAPDEALDAQWQDFIKRNPQLKAELQQAIDYLKSTGLNKSALNDAERVRLFQKIQSTIERKTKRAKVRRVIQYSVTSCAAIALIVIGLNLFVFQEKESEAIADGQELIVGNLLNSQDIQLITGEASMSFQNDIEVKIDQKGTAKIIQENEDDKTLNITPNTLNKLVIPYGKRTQLTLADGSRVWLNSGSVLEFPAQFTGKNREIRLASGEMYIEVTKNEQKPFHVHTSDFNVRVYGTKFNISAYSGSPQSVVLVEGSVSLQSDGKQEQFLLPNEQAIYAENGTFSTQKVDVNRFICWKNGYLEFNKTPMTEVLQQIARYYNLAFDFDNDVNLQKRTCTGKIYLSDNLDNVMTTVGLLSSTKYTKNNNQIVITNEPD